MLILRCRVNCKKITARIIADCVICFYHAKAKFLCIFNLLSIFYIINSINLTKKVRCFMSKTINYPALSPAPYCLSIFSNAEESSLTLSLLFHNPKITFILLLIFHYCFQTVYSSKNEMYRILENSKISEHRHTNT